MKAFDTVPHDGLLHKISKNRIKINFEAGLDHYIAIGHNVSRLMVATLIQSLLQVEYPKEMFLVHSHLSFI